MNTAPHDELQHILGNEESAIADALMQHKVRRDRDIDHAARNLSVSVAERLQKKKRTSIISIAGLATASAAAIVVMISLNPIQQPTSNVSGIPQTQTQRVVSSTEQTSQEPLANAAAASVQASAPSSARRVVSVSDETILEQEAEYQLVNLLADAVTDETVWTITNEDVDMILQENSNDNGL